MKKIEDYTKTELMVRLRSMTCARNKWCNKCTIQKASLLVIKNQLKRISEHITVTNERRVVTYHSGKIRK